MKLHPMPDIEVANPAPHGARILIPGGWNARVPEITIDDTSLRIYAAALGSTAEAASLHQRTYESGFLTGLRLAIARRAREYARRWPQLQKPAPLRFQTSRKYVTLLGFKPEVVQATYIPFDYPGRAGNEAAREVLQQLAQEAT